jgi:LysR family transcriptional activator of nhaA
VSRLNYRHLQYFGAVVRTGGVRAAAEQLHLTPQTISTQLHHLEQALGTKLLRRAGRGVEPTAAGRVALRYAEEIFSLGDELAEVLRSGTPDRTLVFRVGLLDSIPKSIARWLIEPALALAEPMRIVCLEKPFSELLGALAVHRLDLVIADTPYPPGLDVKCFNHPLGGSALSCFAAPALAARHRGTFPARLDGAPLLLPPEDTAWRGAMLAWMRNQGVQPWIRGEFDDTSLMKAFGQTGTGFFFAPSVTAAEIRAQYGLREVGTVADVRLELYAISVERRITHPAVRAITEHARGELLPGAGRAARARPGAKAPLKRPA